VTELKSLDKSASVDIKALQKSPSIGRKHPPSDLTRSYDENEFANRLNAPRSTSLRATSYSLADLQLATVNFATGRLLGEGSIGRVYRAKYADGKVFSTWSHVKLKVNVIWQLGLTFLI